MWGLSSDLIGRHLPVKLMWSSANKWRLSLKATIQGVESHTGTEEQHLEVVLRQQLEVVLRWCSQERKSSEDGATK